MSSVFQWFRNNRQSHKKHDDDDNDDGNNHQQSSSSSTLLPYNSQTTSTTTTTRHRSFLSFRRSSNTSSSNNNGNSSSTILPTTYKPTSTSSSSSSSSNNRLKKYHHLRPTSSPCNTFLMGGSYYPGKDKYYNTRRSSRRHGGGQNYKRGLCFRIFCSSSYRIILTIITIFYVGYRHYYYYGGYYDKLPMVNDNISRVVRSVGVVKKEVGRWRKKMEDKRRATKQQQQQQQQQGGGDTTAIVKDEETTITPIGDLEEADVARLELLKQIVRENEEMMAASDNNNGKKKGGGEIKDETTIKTGESEEEEEEEIGTPDDDDDGRKTGEDLETSEEDRNNSDVADDNNNNDANNEDSQQQKAPNNTPHHALITLDTMDTSQPCPPLTTPPSITLITQSTLSRLYLMSAICQRWSSPIILVIFFPSPPTSPSWKTDHDLPSADDCPQLTVVEYVAADDDNDIDYPINKLRNVGLSRVTTSHVFVIDVDFVPSFDIPSSVLPHLKNNEHDDDNTAYVIPAFEYDNGTPCNSIDDCRSSLSRARIPSNRDELRSCIAEDKRCRVFQIRDNWEGHFTTDSQSWLTSSSVRSIPCFHTPRYEPYLLLRYCPNDGGGRAPRYDERFFGYGKNKISYVSHVRYVGYEFKVLPNVFVIHRPHPVSKAKKGWLVEGSERHGAMDQLYVRFMRGLMRRYGRPKKVGICEK